MTDSKNRKLDCEIQRRLRAAGVPSEAEPQRVPSDLKVQLTGESILFDLEKAGGTGLFVDCTITNCSWRPLTISDIDVTFPWEDDDFAWLCDPQTSGKEEYCILGGWTFPWESVLNHRILEDGRIPADRVLRGFLLGFSMNSIPASYSHGAFVSIKLSMIDHRDRPHGSKLTVRVDRPLRIGRMRRARAGARLYEVSPATSLSFRREFGESHSGKLELLIDRSEKSAGVRHRVGEGPFAPEPSEPPNAPIMEPHGSNKVTDKFSTYKSLERV